MIFWMMWAWLSTGSAGLKIRNKYSTWIHPIHPYIQIANIHPMRISCLQILRILYRRIYRLRPILLLQFNFHSLLINIFRVMNHFSKIIWIWWWSNRRKRPAGRRLVDRRCICCGPLVPSFAHVSWWHRGTHQTYQNHRPEKERENVQFGQNSVVKI